MRDHDECEPAINAALARGDDGRALYLATRCDLVHGVIEAPPEPPSELRQFEIEAEQRYRTMTGMDEPIEVRRARARANRARLNESTVAEKVAALVHPDVSRVRQYRGADSPIDHGRVREAMRRFRPGQPLGWVIA